MSMTKYECAVDNFQGRFDLSHQDYPTLEALNAGGEAIEFLYLLRHKLVWSDSGAMYEKIDNLLREWD